MRLRALILVYEVGQCGCVHIPRTDLVRRRGRQRLQQSQIGGRTRRAAEGWL